MYKRILIVVDPRAVSRAAIKEGVAMAALQGADVVFFHVMPRYSVPLGDMPPFVAVSPQDFRDVAVARADKLLANAAAAAQKAGVKSQKASGSGDDDARCIVEAARKRRCDLIVVATEGRNALLRLLSGSVVPGLITASPVPVLVVKEGGRTKVGTRAVVVPIKPRRAAAARPAATPMQRPPRVSV